MPDVADDHGPREAIVRSAVDEWTRRLVNLDGHNRMLYFRELSRGTLEITPDLAGVRRHEVERLLAGGQVKVSDLFDESALDDAALRALALANKARSNFEEKGLATLYIGHSFATWKRADGHTPRAPVVMIPARIRIVGPSGDDAVIELRGSAEVNPSLVHAMREDLGTDPYPSVDDRDGDFKSWVDHVAFTCDRIQDFAIDDKVFIANLEFSKLPMVNDLEQHVSLLVDNDIVAAIAGDETARAGLKGEIAISADLPDHIPPEDEYLVCDADASQNYAVEAALRGHSLVIHGPPGTGKSQTIANLISSLAARGKSVLFVAEKRAAIGAVARRLTEAGAGELILDLHDGSSRRQVIRDLETSIDGIDLALRTDIVPPHTQLAAARHKLVAHRRQMHMAREPHGLTFFDLQAMLGTPDQEQTGLRIQQDVLANWDAPGRERISELINQWCLLAERLDDDSTGLWSASVVRTRADASEATAAVEHLVANVIPAIDDALQSSFAELSLPASSEVQVEAFSSYLSTIADLASRRDAKFLENADDIATSLRHADRSWLGRFFARITDGKYRRASRNLGHLGAEGEGVKAVLQDARRARVAQKTWGAWFPGHPQPTQASSAAALAAALREYEAARDRLVVKVPGLSGLSGFRAEEQAIRSLDDHRDLADARAEITRVADEIGEYGLRGLLRLSEKGNRDPEALDAMATRVFAASAIDAITWQEPELAVFNGATHEESARRFAELDAKHLGTTAQRVMKLVAENAENAMSKWSRETVLVKHEVGAPAHHMPIRQLLAAAPNVIKALRPCWAMSPLLVSRMLPATRNMFDVVIFDEGSQVLPIHAVPAIARGSQVVVAGDPHQLPPAEFIASDSVEDEIALGTSATPAADAESILDVMREMLLERDLLWHYRSQDERLINFSNTHIYGRSLVSFPGTNRDTGISSVYVDSLPRTNDGISSNPDVVAKTVELILDHARTRPHESLGVIGLGLRHANDVSRALRVARLESREDFGGFFDEKGAEPFFVKTMSTAQGDERDHIIFSFGYGKDPQGQMVYRWGTLGRRGGERRLNVAVTRSKRRMTVVSSVTSQDIDPAKTRARGAVLLREFLEYAEQGGESIEGPDTAPLTAFEQSVLERLSDAGIPIKSHYGGGRLRIDFAAFQTLRKAMPLLAIETDGLGYDSSETARDRDRLRLEVLRKRGWRFHRIWSIDWYRDPEGETERAKHVWEKAVAESRDPSLTIGGTSDERPVVAGRGRSPIAIKRTGILGYERSELVKLLRWIESDGIQRTEVQLMAVAADVLGIEDPTNHVVIRALRGAIGESRADEHI